MELTPEEKAALRVDNSDSYRANALPKDYRPGVPPSGVQLVPTRYVRFRESGVEAHINTSDFDPQLHEDPTVAKKAATSAPDLEKLTVAELTELAKAKKVDLGEASKKAEIIAVLVAAGVMSAS